MEQKDNLVLNIYLGVLLGAFGVLCWQARQEIQRRLFAMEAAVTTSGLVILDRGKPTERCVSIEQALKEIVQAVATAAAKA